MFFALLKWWYGEGWLEAWRQILSGAKKVQNTFSVPLLFGTLFAPWKQIITTGGPSLDDKFKALLDNLFSRAVGFAVRACVLVAALFAMAAAAVGGLALALAWPLVPVAIIFCVYKGVAG